jgi:hypothetical protein
MHDKLVFLSAHVDLPLNLRFSFYEGFAASSNGLPGQALRQKASNAYQT